MKQKHKNEQVQWYKQQLRNRRWRLLFFDDSREHNLQRFWRLVWTVLQPYVAAYGAIYFFSLRSFAIYIWNVLVKSVTLPNTNACRQQVHLASKSSKNLMRLPFIQLLRYLLKLSALFNIDRNLSDWTKCVYMPLWRNTKMNDRQGTGVGKLQWQEKYEPPVCIF